jgi:hypothetical protein
MLLKIKLHLLVHSPDDIRRFGPLVGVATEIYECFNAVFRLSSIHSNHLAPSRDIAMQLADQEGLKHRITGGWWLSSNNEWVRASKNVRNFLLAHPALQNALGWVEKEIDLPGIF